MNRLLRRLAAFLFADQATEPRSHQATKPDASSAHDPAAASWLDGSTPGSYIIRQRFRHRYEVDPSYIDRLQNAGLIFSGRHPEQPIMQILELPREMHPYFVAGQFHPELLSRPLRPHPMFMGLIAAAIQHANPDAAAAQISTRWLPQAEAKTPA
mgnify:FL=1